MASAETPPAPSGVASWLNNPTFRRVLILVVLSVATALLLVDFVRVPDAQFEVGAVADRDVRAPTSFQFVDWEATMARQRAAEESVLPVFDLDTTLGSRVGERVQGAFEQARMAHADALLGARAEGREDLTPEELSAVGRDFLKQLELSLAPEDIDRIVALQFSEQVQDRAQELASMAMRGKIVADKSLLPRAGRAVEVVHILREGREVDRLEDLSEVRTPAEARQAVSIYLLETEADSANDPVLQAAVAVARASIRPNFSYNQLVTEDRRREARNSVAEVVIHVGRGTAIVREGDVLDAQHVTMIQALQQNRSGVGMVGVILALVAFTGMAYLAIYQFSSGFLRKFSTELRDLEAGAVVALMVLGLGRLLVELSGPLSVAGGSGVLGASIWYLAPFAGGAMLMRILVNSETALVWIMTVGVLMGVLMDHQVLLAIYFVISGVTAAAALAHTRERVNVLRAGVTAGLVNAGAALLLNLVSVHLTDASITAEGSQPLWDVAFAFGGGVFSAILVLGLVPLFELAGFVTDYKLLELANLNHPLLRQLMLRAPGTYHHSVTVAQLCESAAEAIGANALMTRVACYFHDIGKAVNPRFFIENQRGGPNPHDRIGPYQSARIIVNHVVDGAAIARQHKMPKPVLDGILMHHGTGRVEYFYIKALEAADDPTSVNEADFRYPGIKPDSREMGIMLLADKVEAACRTLKDKSPDNIRALIQKLVNGAVTDGQLDDCPLTVRELYQIVEAFTQTLMGIYHSRIDYPGAPTGASGEVHKHEETTGPIITLEMQNPLAAAVQAEAEGTATPKASEEH